MGLNSLKVFLVCSFLVTGVANAEIDAAQRDYLTLDSMEVREITTDVLNQEVPELISEQDLHEKSQASLNNIGGVIMIAREIVALGEDIYNLVKKGQPILRTSYAPISVIPKVNGQPADVFDMENWKMPSKRTYEITYKNLYGMQVVKFRYSVIYTYGGTYNGKGAYLTSSVIVPESVNLAWGYNLSANMKLQGIQNHGTKSDPVAGAIMTMEYTVETLVQSSLESESYHLTGRGGFKQL